MTDKHSGYVITLDKSIRENDAEPTINAIRQIKGVISVRPVVEDVEGLIAQARAEEKLRHAMLDVLMPLIKYKG